MWRRIVPFFLMLFLFVPEISLADAWTEYNDFNDGFYFLSDQGFTSLSCGISLPDFEKMLDDNREQFKAAGQDLLIEENLADFSFTLKKGGDLTFNKPDITVRIRQVQGPKRSELETGARMIDNGFRSTVDGTIMTLTGVFDSFIRPVRPAYLLEMFEYKDNRASFRYEHEGVLINAECIDMECVKKASTVSYEMEARENYISAAGKKIINKLHGTIKQPQQTVVSDLSITYQVVKGLRIPFMLNSDSTITHSTGTMSGTFKILLKDCEVR